MHTMLHYYNIIIIRKLLLSNGVLTYNDRAGKPTVKTVGVCQGVAARKQVFQIPLG